MLIKELQEIINKLENNKKYKNYIVNNYESITIFKNDMNSIKIDYFKNDYKQFIVIKTF